MAVAPMHAVAITAPQTPIKSIVGNKSFDRLLLYTRQGDEVVEVTISRAEESRGGIYSDFVYGTHGPNGGAGRQTLFQDWLDDLEPMIEFGKGTSIYTGSGKGRTRPVLRAVAIYTTPMQGSQLIDADDTRFDQRWFATCMRHDPKSTAEEDPDEISPTE